MNVAPESISRRSLLVGALGLAGVSAAVATGILVGDDDRPLAMVYRGPASCSGCSEAVAHLFETGSTPLRVQYCGPNEDLDVPAGLQARPLLYAQPGGGNLHPAWRRTREYAGPIRDFVAAGGTYLGFCLGAYLAGTDHGFGLFPGTIRQYIDTESATVADTEDTVVRLLWRGEPRHMYFQDGPTFTVPGNDWARIGGQTLAHYDNGGAAAVITTYKAGRVGLVGPHPEADESWYSAAGLSNPDGIRFDLGHDLVRTTLAR